MDGAEYWEIDITTTVTERRRSTSRVLLESARQAVPLLVNPVTHAVQQNFLPQNGLLNFLLVWRPKKVLRMVM